MNVTTVGSLHSALAHNQKHTTCSARKQALSPFSECIRMPKVLCPIIIHKAWPRKLAPKGRKTVYEEIPKVVILSGEEKAEMVLNIVENERIFFPLSIMPVGN